MFTHTQGAFVYIYLYLQMFTTTVQNFKIFIDSVKNINKLGDFLIQAFTAMAWVQSVVGKLRSHKLHGQEY